MAGPHKYCEVFYDNVRIPLTNVVGGLHNGWATANATLSFERGTAALALLIGYVLKVEALLADCPQSRPELRMRIASLRAEGASIRAANYKLALDLENRSEEHTSELQSLMRISYAVFCLKKKKK